MTYSNNQRGSSTVMQLCEASRPLVYKGEVIGIFRTLKRSGPSPGGAGHRAKVQDFGATKDSGPSSGGTGHGLETAQEAVKVVKDSGPSPGQGH
ncbi:putative transmembrane protein [Senna tora]|uniref:Putative transmembrane protein n=1 Tax=Senna tora TaxID=362788 RepID=A0A834XAP0_9FABA|nr:putative transmembrane protein [Senna tora]